MWEGTGTNPRHPPAWLPGGSAGLTIAQAADYTPGLSRGQFSPSPLAPVLGVALEVLVTPGISSDQGTMRYQLSNQHTKHTIFETI